MFACAHSSRAAASAARSRYVLGPSRRRPNRRRNPRQLHVFYDAHAPEKLEQLDKIAKLYGDDPATLWAQLFEKYATTPDEQARIRAEGARGASVRDAVDERARDQDYAARYDRLVAGDS